MPSTESLKDKIQRILNASIQKLEDRILNEEKGKEVYSKDLINAIRVLYTIAESEVAKELGGGDPAIPLRYSKNQKAWVKPPEIPEFPLSTKPEKAVDNQKEQEGVKWITP